MKILIRGVISGIGGDCLMQSGHYPLTDWWKWLPWGIAGFALIDLGRWASERVK